MLHREGAKILSDFCVVGNVLGNDIRSTLQSGRDVGHLLALLGRDKAFRKNVNCRLVCVSLFQNILCQRLQPLGSCDGGTGGSLRLEGTVNILQLHERLCHTEGGLNLGSELFLCGNQRGNFLTALIHLAQILQTVVQSAQGGIVHAARYLLAVTRDEGDRVALVDKSNGFFHLFSIQSEFFG